MKTEAKKLQLDVLKKLQATGFEVNMDLDLWHPDRKTVDYLFSFEGFNIDPNGDTICTFRQIRGDTVEVTLFCSHKDADYLKKKIKQRREVSK